MCNQRRPLPPSPRPGLFLDTSHHPRLTYPGITNPAIRNALLESRVTRSRAMAAAAPPPPPPPPPPLAANDSDSSGGSDDENDTPGHIPLVAIPQNLRSKDLAVKEIVFVPLGLQATNDQIKKFLNSLSNRTLLEDANLLFNQHTRNPVPIFNTTFTKGETLAWLKSMSLLASNFLSASSEDPEETKSMYQPLKKKYKSYERVTLQGPMTGSALAGLLPKGRRECGSLGFLTLEIPFNILKRFGKSVCNAIPRLMSPIQSLSFGSSSEGEDVTTKRPPFSTASTSNAARFAKSCKREIRDASFSPHTPKAGPSRKVFRARSSRSQQKSRRTLSSVKISRKNFHHHSRRLRTQYKFMEPFPVPLPFGSPKPYVPVLPSEETDDFGADALRALEELAQMPDLPPLIPPIPRTPTPVTHSDDEDTRSVISIHSGPSVKDGVPADCSVETGLPDYAFGNRLDYFPDSRPKSLRSTPSDFGF